LLAAASLRPRWRSGWSDKTSHELLPVNRIQSHWWHADVGYAPWRLALVTLLQFREGLSDRQAAKAVRGRIDWKHLLALDLADAGFGHSVLCEFRGRLLEHGAGERLLGRILDAAREGGLLQARGRQRTDSTHVLAAVRDLNRVELLAETLRAALNEIAVATPDWLQPAQGRGPGDRVESPYDTDARFRTKGGTCWTGYMVHLTESCDAGAPRLVLHADTTPANVHEAPRTAPIHDALAAKGLAPSEHLVDSAYVSAEHLIAARERHGIDLVGPGRRNLSWQSRDEGAFGAADFAVDWDGRAVRCPEGKVSAGWAERAGGPGRRGAIRIQFRAADCRGCPSRARCTRSRSGYSGRVLTLLPRREHEALAATRAREGTAEGRRLYAQL
jgi:transposase